MSSSSRRSVVAVLVSRRNAVVLFLCGCTPTHPFVNTPALTGSRSDRLQASDTDDLIATVSRVAGPPQSGERPAAEAGSKWHLRLALRREGLFAALTSVAKGRYNRLYVWFDVFLRFAMGGVSFSKGFPAAPSVVAVASALTQGEARNERSEWGRCVRQDGTGRTPFVEPEQRSSLMAASQSSTFALSSPAAVLLLRTVVRT